MWKLKAAQWQLTFKLLNEQEGPHTLRQQQNAHSRCFLLFRCIMALARLRRRRVGFPEQSGSSCLAALCVLSVCICPYLSVRGWERRLPAGRHCRDEWWLWTQRSDAEDDDCFCRGSFELSAYVKCSNPQRNNAPSCSWPVFCFYSCSLRPSIISSKSALSGR